MRLDEVSGFAAPEADRAAALNSSLVCVTDSHRIAKCRKYAGVRVEQKVYADRGIKRSNSGVVVGGHLYSAHSNYSELSMTSSVEVFDAGTLEYVDNHRFGISEGFATGTDYRDGFSKVCLIQCPTCGGALEKGPQWTTKAKLDTLRVLREAFAFPPELVSRPRPCKSCVGAGRVAVRQRTPSAGTALVEFARSRPASAPSGCGDGFACGAGDRVGSSASVGVVRN